METPFEKNIWKRKTFKHLNKGSLIVVSSFFFCELPHSSFCLRWTNGRGEGSLFLGFGKMWMILCPIWSQWDKNENWKSSPDYVSWWYILLHNDDWEKSVLEIGIRAGIRADRSSSHQGSRLIPNRMFFYTLCKRPLTLPSPSCLHNHVVNFLTWMLKSA